MLNKHSFQIIVIHVRIIELLGIPANGQTAHWYTHYFFIQKQCVVLLIGKFYFYLFVYLFLTLLFFSNSLLVFFIWLLPYNMDTTGLVYCVYFLYDRQVSMDVQKETMKKQHEEEAWYRQQQLLMQAEERRRKMIQDEEQKLVDQRKRYVSVCQHSICLQYLPWIIVFKILT